jgi:type VI secretion system FHA domain protein
MASFKLVVTIAGNEQKALAEHVCEKEHIAIGRAAGNDVILPDVEKRISGRHARIDRSGGSCHLVDLGSTNGTFLNDRKLEPNSGAELKDGDRISVGNYLLKFIAMEGTAEQTVVLVDPSRLSSQLAEELPVLYARHAGRGAEDRRKVLKEAIRSAVKSAGPEAARAVLSQLQARFKPGESAAAGGDRGTMVRQRDAEIQRREELFQAGAKVLGEMSRHFTGEGAFETAAQAELFGKLVTQAMDLTVEWVSRSLKGRKEFESQFSADLTMVFSHEKNPVKAAAGPQELGKFLLDWRSPRSTTGVRDSLENAFKDLTMHQLGLLAGVQEALGAVLQRLDPKVVEAEAKKGGGVFASAEKKAWKRYTEIFQEIFAENSKLFNELIYPNVRKGYLGSHSPSDAKTPLPPTAERTIKKEGESP